MIYSRTRANSRYNNCIIRRMEIEQLKTLIKVKTEEFEKAIESKKPHAELHQIYKEIKQITFEITQKENKISLIAD